MSRLVLLLSFVLTFPVLARHQETGFLDRTVTVDGTAYHYQIYVPANWNSGQKWPVILFLHGAGERGEDGLQQTQVGLGAAIRLHADRYPAIVVMPQCRSGVWWTDPKMEPQSLAALQHAMKEFHGDPDRVYLTGLSMGGYGSWSLAEKYPDKWAAVVAICGGIRLPPAAGQSWTPEAPGVNSYGDAARKIGSKLPVWVFHGDADPAVPVEESRRMVEELKAIGSTVKYTEYEGVKHNSWDKAYAELDLPVWLFAQHK
jgi:predicted peptidase